jgi:PAS domain S-box-containing protein
VRADLKVGPSIHIRLARTSASPAHPPRPHIRLRQPAACRAGARRASTPVCTTAPIRDPPRMIRPGTPDKNGESPVKHPDPPSVSPPDEFLDAPSTRDVLVVRFHLMSATLSGAVIAIAAGALFGWWWAIPALKSIVPGSTTMKVNSAVALILTGVALLVHRGEKYNRRRELVLRYSAGVAAAIACLTTIEHVSGVNLRIDQLLMRDDGLSSAPGRMALATAVCLMLVNVALLIADIPRRYGIAQILIAGAAVLATLNGVGYVFGLEAFTGVASYSAMALHVSISILMICLAFLFARPEEGLMDAVVDGGPGGLVIRQLLPAVFFLPLLLAWLSWQGVRAGWYEASFAMAVFVALTLNVLSYAIWAGGHVLRGFENKRLAAEGLRASSEERLRRAVADAPIPMIIHDEGEQILYMSRGWSDLCGYGLQATPKVTDWIAKVEPAGAGALTAYFTTVRSATETMRGGEYPIRTSTGAGRVWEFSTTPLGGAASEARTLVTMAVDITERKEAAAQLRSLNEGLEQRIAARTAELTQANDALKRQSDQLKEQATLLDLVRDGILVRDLYGTVVYWSAGAVDMYGWPAAEALGKVSHQVFRAEYPRPLADIEQQVMSAGFWEGEVVHTTKAGTRILVESRWTLTRNERGAPQGFLEVNRDITARKRTQDSLRDSELRFRAVAETAIEGIFSMDDRGKIRYWNPGAERMFGRPVSEAVGAPVSVAVPGRFLTPAQIKSGEPVVGTTFETDGLRKDGSPFPLELSLSAWATSQGTRFYTAIARDITARKAAERALETKADELSRSNQELEQFAYVASHDLQEPLRMVSNYTQLLARRYKDQLDADANEFIDFAVDGAKRMQELIHDLLQYARVGTRGKEFKAAAADQIVADAVANLTGAIEEAGAEVLVDRLPTLHCDASQLVQVFQNLIGNAIKFRRPGGKPVVRVSASRGEQATVLSVADNGIGIEPKYFERIFQMFQRLHGRSEYPGTGIGLALCKKIVERHGGRIRVDSEAGQGTTFSFTIPDPSTRPDTAPS